MGKWDKYAVASEAAPQVSKTESSLRGAAQGATLGLGDELSAYAEGTMANLPQFLGGLSDKEYQDVYGGKTPEDLIRENRATIAEAQKANPKSFGGGRLLGVIPTAAALGAIPGTQTLGGATLLGATTGAAQGYGESEKKGNALVQDALKGGVAGGLLGAITNRLINAKTLEKYATGLARRALGFTKSTIKKAGGLQSADNAAKTLLEAGAIKGGVEEIAANVDAMKGVSGKFIGDTLDKLDEAGIAGLDTDKIVKAVRDAKIDPRLNLTIEELMDLPAFSHLRNSYVDIIATAKSPRFNVPSAQAGTFRAAQELKSALKDLAYGTGSKTPNAPLAQKAYKIVTKSIDDAIKDAAPKIGDPGLAKQFLEAKKIYGASRIAEKGLEDKLISSSGNKVIGLTDTILATGLAGTPLTSLAAVAAKKTLESGAAKSAGARGLMQLSKISKAIPIPNQGAPVGAGITGVITARENQ